MYYVVANDIIFIVIFKKMPGPIRKIKDELPVRDLESSISFYETGHGFSVVSRNAIAL
jgi:hypothetical protein